MLRPETRVLLLSDPIDYDAFYWLGPLWFRQTGVHIQGANFDPFGVVDVPAMRRELRNLLTAYKPATRATGSSGSPSSNITAPRHAPPHPTAPQRIPVASHKIARQGGFFGR